MYSSTTLTALALTAVAIAQSTTQAPDIANAQDSLEGLIFLDTADGGSVLPATGYDASVVCAGPSETTYVLGCAQTNSPNSLCAQEPKIEISMVSRSTDYELMYRTGVQGVVGTVTQSCAYPPSTSATCSLLGYLYRGASTVTLTSTVQTLSSEQLPPTATISITAGADNTRSSCSLSTSSSTSLSPTAGGGGGSSNGADNGSSESANAAIAALPGTEVYKVLIPVGLGALAMW